MPSVFSGWLAPPNPDGLFENEIVKDPEVLQKWERAAVARGARLLDECVTHWWVLIDLDLLVLDSSKFDILGQLYGTWLHGLSKLSISIEAAPGFGFQSIVIDYGPEIEGSYTRLEEYWTEEITDRYLRCKLPASCLID